MTKYIFLTCYLFVSQVVLAQKKVNYYKDIAPILANNCVSCHRPGGLGPFSLTNFEEVKNKIKLIIEVTQSRYMPPWKADPSFRSFKNERILSATEIETLSLWADNGLKRGRSQKNIRLINERYKMPEPDLVLTMDAPYELSDKSIEDYRFFNIPTQLKEDVYLSAVEFVPGNKQVLHHSRVMADTTNRIRGINGLSEYDPKALDFQKEPLADEFLYGWVPGNLPVLYPKGTGKKLYSNTDLILNIHYAPTSKKGSDQSQVKLYFAKDPVESEIKVMTIRESDISNQPFYIQANTKPTFYVSYTLEEEINMVSILPHMHFIGKSFKALAITMEGDAIPIIKIDQWDFNWQTTYLFETPLTIPKGSVILLTATYDNTDTNPENPNYPSKDISYGWNSDDEMMNFVIYYY